VHSCLPEFSAFFIIESALASGSNKTISKTSFVLLKSHFVGDLSEALSAHVHAVLADYGLLAATSAAHVGSPAKLLA
jgi:hypothetical protein